MGFPVKGRADYLELGDYNVLCGQCGRKRKFSTMKKLPPGVPGAGLFVCPEHWDYRHPQEFVRAVPDVMTVPQAQPPAALITPQQYIIVVQSGTPDALILTASETIIGPFAGQIFQFVATATNTGAAQAKLAGGSFYDIELDSAALVAGDITLGTTYYLTFGNPAGDESVWELSS